ncbi:MAG: hypothetical protein P8Z78_07580 [Gammaproteobacteria bacterium]
MLALQGCNNDDDSSSGGQEPVERAGHDEIVYNEANETFSFPNAQNEITESTLDEVQRDLNGALCGQCHTGALDSFKDSVHYQLKARTDRVMFPGGGAHGAIDRACGLPGTSALVNYTSDINLGECAKCHAGRYLPVMEGALASNFAQMGLPDPEGQAASIVNSGVDCLICHAEVYSSVPGGEYLVVSDHAPDDGASPTPLGYAKAAHDNGDFNQDGMLDAQIDTDGDGEPDVPLMMDTDGDGQPDTPFTTVAQDRSVEAILSVGYTDEHSCLRCHEHARTGYKRATLFLDGYDVHATATSGPFDGALNQCTVCHSASQHKFVRGHNVGGDLAAADYPPPPPGEVLDPDDPTNVMCTTCHDPETLPTDDTISGEMSVHSNRHLKNIACETCHIPLSGGISYSVYGEGMHLSFGRNADGKDTKLISADHMQAGDRADVDADYLAYKMPATLVWFNGGSSFLAQTLAAKGAPNAMITPFKPMANGMVFDARFFSGETVKNDAGADYNAHSMYRFYANKDDGTGIGNAEVFAAMDMLDLTPDETRRITLADFQSEDPDRQAMAMMQIFPNMIHFDKAVYGYEHYMISSDPKFDIWDADSNGVLDVGADFHFNRFEAAQAGLQSFKGFNAPMGLPAGYDWYPPFESTDDLVTMKLPDGSLMKMFLAMQTADMNTTQAEKWLAAIEEYPAFSNGVTLGGHGVRPKEEALGAGGLSGCRDCHASGGMMTNPIPVTRKTPVEMPGMGTVELPQYQWHFYNIHALANLGLTVEDGDIVAGTADVDIEGDTNFVRVAGQALLLNWFAPTAPVPAGFLPYTPADDPAILGADGVGLTADELTKNGGSWMPVLEPLTDPVENYRVLGYDSTILWMD